nr:immunoglobulin light chain junction region [Macaca mulatta]MOW12408.1 immunoglobulin light chain junction region [Macaca mulatta]
CQHSQSIPFTF